jgi:serine-type D-Ala-D-Ala carboxypeptidase (penicillin-binding protein 5/6)
VTRSKRVGIGFLLIGWLVLPARADEAASGRASHSPPSVSARSWVIMDGASGEILWGQEERTASKAASTTKIMCAYVVLQLAEKDAGVLDEIVTISRFADDTSGSTADVREGERLAVRDLLYGLMLPSGNDAGNALAEHFNDRFESLQEGETPDLPQTSRTNFVAEMNRTAKKLGLAGTTYRIPYGDGGSPEDRTTTAADLLRLTRVAMQLERFREIVATKEHTSSITTPDGGERQASWSNTNRLLSEEGFDGVKTGKTRLAGACLVSSHRRDGAQLLAVVLGSESSDARYDDTRALVQWAWSQLDRRQAGDGVVTEPLLTVERGTLPIILTSPHGGHLPVPGAPRRVGGEHIYRFVAGTDVRTAELTELIADGIERELGGRPYVVIARFQRRFADVNRSAEHAYEHELAAAQYDAFHGAIREASADIRVRFGHGLLLDVHGQGTRRDAIYRGTRNGKAVRDLLQREGVEAVIGEKSVFGQFALLGYETLPEHDGTELGEETQYTGGYITDAHGSHNDTRIDAIQLEFGTHLRLPEHLERTAAETARAIATFARAYLPPPSTD